MDTNLRQQLDQYKTQIDGMKKTCEKAEKEKIALEANLKMYKEQRDALEKECEQTAGVPIKDIPQLLDTKMKMLTSMMDEINALNLNTNLITEDSVNAIETIMAKYNVAVPAQQ